MSPDSVSGWRFGLAVAVVSAGVACGHTAPTAPGAGTVTPSDYVLITGAVYQRATTTAGEPRIAEVLVEVTHADGSVNSDLTDTDGSYQVRLRPGPVTVRAVKDGYQPRISSVVVSSDLVLNFSLSPI
jgi:hypothetical protein